MPGDPGLYNAQLWFMTRGSYNVEVAVEGHGGGSVQVPVNSVAYSRKPMPPALQIIAVGLLVILSVGLISIAAAAFRESHLGEGAAVSPGSRRRGWAGAVLGVTMVCGAYWGGNLWWESEDSDHQSRVLFRPMQHEVAFEGDAGKPRLRLEIVDGRMTNRNYALIPDHGKLVHLFLIGAGGAPAFAHLHPRRESARRFEAALPPLAAGTYRVFADVTHESGITETVTNSLTLPAVSVATDMPDDPDDSFRRALAPTELGTKEDVGEGLAMTLRMEGGGRSGEAVVLRASVVNEAGSPVPLQPYLRMLGHAAVMREDGGTFAHVHPAGTLSMAAARKFASRSGDEEAGRAVDEVCGDLSVMPEAQALAAGKAGRVGFPYVFPGPGTYRVWVQVKVAGRILSAAFRVEYRNAISPTAGSPRG